MRKITGTVKEEISGRQEIKKVKQGILTENRGFDRKLYFNPRLYL